MGLDLLTKTEGCSLRWLKRRAYDWSSFPVIIRGGKTPVLYYVTLWVKNLIYLVFLKIPVTFSFGRHCSSTHSRWEKRAAGNPLPIPVPDNSFWSILGKSVESCYNFILVCQISLFLFLPSTCYWGSIMLLWGWQGIPAVRQSSLLLPSGKGHHNRFCCTTAYFPLGKILLALFIKKKNKNNESLRTACESKKNRNWPHVITICY